MVDLLSDQPLTNPSDDALDRTAFAQEFAKSILTVDTSTSFVYSIEGDWGSGKSTILEFTKHYLTHRDKLGERIPLEANPIIIDLSLWWFSGSGDLLHQFLGQISAQLRGKLPWALQKLPGLLDTLSDGLTLASAAAPVLAAAIPATKAAAAIATRAATPPDLHALHGKLRKLLEEQSQRIVVFLDDIDRLQPDEILQVFQAVKAIAALPRLIYVLAFDRSAVAAALQRAGIEDPDEYLEKIIQLPLNVPLPGSDDLRRLTKEWLTEAIGPSGITSHPRWRELNSGGLDQLIHNLRDAKRLANAVRASLPPVRDEVDLVDFIGFQALRLFAPAVYNFVRQNRAWILSSNVNPALGLRFNVHDKSYYKQPLDRALESASGTRTSIEQILQLLFPILTPLFNDGPQFQAPSDDTIREWQLDRRICSSDHFDYYDRLAIPPGRLPHSAIVDFLAMQGQSPKDTILRLAREQWPDGAPKLPTFLQQAQEEVSRGTPVSAPQDWLNAIFGAADQAISSQAPSQQYVGDAYLFAGLAEAVLSCPNLAVNPTDALNAALANEPSIDFVACVYGRSQSSGQRNGPGSVLERLTTHLLQRIKREANAGTLKNAGFLRWLLDFWDSRENEAGTKYAQSCAETDEGLAYLLAATPGERPEDEPAIERWTGLDWAEAHTRCVAILNQNPRPKWLTKTLENALLQHSPRRFGPPDGVPGPA